jgi:hypothetical protein
MMSPTRKGGVGVHAQNRDNPAREAGVYVGSMPGGESEELYAHRLPLTAYLFSIHQPLTSYRI